MGGDGATSGWGRTSVESFQRRRRDQRIGEEQDLVDIEGALRIRADLDTDCHGQRPEGS